MVRAAPHRHVLLLDTVSAGRSLQAQEGGEAEGQVGISDEFEADGGVPGLPHPASNSQRPPHRIWGKRGGG